jgi:guanine nucleotide-binding protein alpha-1 subunit
MLLKSLRDTDPFAKVLAPPQTESPSERQARLLDEAKAKRLSDSIDDELEKQRIAEKRGPSAVKVLLLGIPPISEAVVSY